MIGKARPSLQKVRIASLSQLGSITPSVTNESQPSDSRISSWGALALSFLISGLGQCVAGRTIAGVLWFFSFLIGWLTILWLCASERFPGYSAALIGVASLLLIWVCMLIHAYRSGTKTTDSGKNRPWVAVLLSALWPGIGQFYNRQILSGVAFFVGIIFLEFAPFEVAVVGAVLLRIWSTVNAFRFAVAVNPTEAQRIRLVLGATVLRYVAVVAVTIGVRFFWIQPFKMPTSSMMPTIQGIGAENGERKECDHLFVDKLAYLSKQPHRGDVVVFRTEGITGLDQDKIYIKRVVGLPGEEVSIRPPFLYIDGQKVTEPPVLEKFQSKDAGYHGFLLARGMWKPAPMLGKESDSIRLGADEYFVLGDNQPNSLDSRYWGPVKRKSIIGKVTKLFWPYERMGIVIE
ncbi:MAG: signal peptidase I [Verrucomicrobiae bacterium]|nr:signal peptidase I [Verrucomicrobiae bacterium]